MANLEGYKRLALAVYLDMCEVVATGIDSVKEGSASSFRKLPREEILSRVRVYQEGDWPRLVELAGGPDWKTQQEQLFQLMSSPGARTKAIEHLRNKGFVAGGHG